MSTTNRTPSIEQVAFDILADSAPTRAELEAEELEARVCRCDHSAHWHGDDGGGMGTGHCEHDGECRCDRFAAQLVAAPLPLPVDFPLSIEDFEPDGPLDREDQEPF